MATRKETGRWSDCRCLIESHSWTSAWGDVDAGAASYLQLFINREEENLLEWSFFLSVLILIGRQVTLCPGRVVVERPVSPMDERGLCGWMQHCYVTSHETNMSRIDAPIEMCFSAPKQDMLACSTV